MKSSTRTASRPVVFALSCTLLLTIFLSPMSRADVWVSVDPDGGVTQSEVAPVPRTNSNPRVAPNPRKASSRVTGNRAAATGSEADTASSVAPRAQYGVPAAGQTVIVGGNYGGYYPPVVPQVPGAVSSYGYYGYPYPYPYPHPNQYPYAVPLTPAPWWGTPSYLLSIPLSQSYYYPYPPAYPCSVCHRHPCIGGHGLSSSTTITTQHGSFTIGSGGFKVSGGRGRTTHTTSGRHFDSGNDLER